MKVVNKAARDEFRKKHTRCEWCGYIGQTQVHHVFAKGHGAGKCLDIPINFISLGIGYGCNCHGKYHAGNLGKPNLLSNKEIQDQFITIIARREKLSEVQVREEIARINQLDKDAPRCHNHGPGKYAGYPLAKGEVSDSEFHYSHYCPECERLKT